MTLPPQVSEVVGPLFSAMALDKAMGQAVVRHRADQTVLKLARGIVADPVLDKSPMLAAGVWLYVDELEAAHVLCQSSSSLTGSFWHAIVHRREGDFSNALYWYRQARHHPVMDRIPGYDPEEIVRLAQENDPSAVALQRKEWATLFEWCAFN
ncbi:MAG: hypothetical protein JST30_14815 [Armatimonadetes bacterium]|nr:hypothetical protein [Armatimonadota bacterium]